VYLGFTDQNEIFLTSCISQINCYETKLSQEKREEVYFEETQGAMESSLGALKA